MTLRVESDKRCETDIVARRRASSQNGKPIMLDPQIEWVLERRTKAGLSPIETLSVSEARRQYEDTASKLEADEVGMERVEEFAVAVAGGEIAVRSYLPSGLPALTRPALVYYHGGGKVIGSLDTHDRLCRLLANQANCIVFSVAYRLAPEHKFPVAVNDSLAAYEWIANNATRFGVDAARIAVGGDSAGGTLSTIACQLAAGRDGPRPCFQLLIYPATDGRGDYTSRRENAKGYLLTNKLINWFSGKYWNGPEDKLDPMVSPLLAVDLSGQPSAHIVTAGYDPLRDEAAAYAKALAAAGVKVDYRNYPGMVHGFFNMSGVVDVAGEAISVAADQLRRAFGGEIT